MRRLILSTSNIINGLPSVPRRSANEKSNIELVSSLRSNLLASKQAAAPTSNGATPADAELRQGFDKASMDGWITNDHDLTYVPSIDFNHTGIAEPRTQYDITAKLFFLPGSIVSERVKQAREAIDFVLQQLHVSFIDLLIVSFPGLSFDNSVSDCDDPLSGAFADSGGSDDIETILRTWGSIESLHNEGLAKKIGVAEFCQEKLEKFLPLVNVKPSVDQINLKDICEVPTPLIAFARREGIDVLTHSDCTNILPGGTLREMLGTRDKGAGLVPSADQAGEDSIGDIRPQWVIKYVAVVQDRGVIEDKGYFAMAEYHQ